VLYLYLVNEVTHKPVIPPGSHLEGSTSIYPLKITAPEEFVRHFMPLIKVGLKATAVWNGVVGLAQCFGYPAMELPEDVSNSIESAVGARAPKSLLAEFDVLQDESDRKARAKLVSEHEATMSGLERKYKNKHDLKRKTNELGQNHTAALDDFDRKIGEKKAQPAKVVRGKQLHDLQAFFSREENDPRGDFSGLSRRVLTSDGSCLWATDTDVEALRRRIEEEKVKEAEESWG